MGTKNLSFIKWIRENFSESAVNIRRKLLFFLLILMFTMLAGVMFIFSLFGVRPFSLHEKERLFENEFSYLSSDIVKQYGNASVQAVRLSRRLFENIAVFMRQKGLFTNELKKHPGLLEPLLRELLPTLLANLDATDCSGAFVTLDATVKPDAAADDSSKAGLYIRNIEPNIRGMGTETRYLLRGTSTLAGNGSLNLQAKWDLEFDITEQLFWREQFAAMEAVRFLPLSRLVYWCSMSPIQGLNEDVMVCSAPLLNEDGKIIGVCGFEISQMNFMARHEPDIKEFHTEVFLFSSESEKGIRLEDALFAGNSAVYSSFPKQGLIQQTGAAGSFMIYTLPGSASFIGMSKRIRLSPDDSPFARQTFTAALLVPKTDFDAAQNAVRLQFGLILFALTALGILASIVLSRRYLNPIIAALGAIRSGNLEGIKTNIVELDQLVEEVRNQRAKDRPFPDDFFAGFIKRVRMLTPVEKTIFRYYLDGMDVKEIMSKMFITKNTVRIHNERMYGKLGVSDKETFMLYVELIRMSGLAYRFKA